MERINFEVGAKAARLIGRENIADVDGALIELIKNAYDADASCVCVCFDMPFPYVPTDVSAHRLRHFMNDADQKEVLLYYDETKSGDFHKKENLTEHDHERLWEIMSHYNTLTIADNGIGMTMSDVKTKWMYIGTSDKEINISSSKGRVKTGAKGIGRFALDKLSLDSRMITRCANHKLVKWNINWEQFEKSKLLNEITAQLEESEEQYYDIATQLLQKRFPKAFTDENDWSRGTMIVLSPLREEWSMRLFEKVNRNLKSINPLGSADPFKVFVKNVENPEYNFETDDVAIDVKDYDYKIKIFFDGDKTLTTILGRNEVDINKRQVYFKKYEQKVDLTSFWSRPYFQKEKCHRQQFAEDITFARDVTKVLKDDPTKIRSVGPFEAELYFLKSKNSDLEIIKPVLAKGRNRLLSKFSGVKIYRDFFKVRPYGDEGSYFDWLELGKRQAESPGGVGSQSGSWRVLAYQLIGQVQIGRISNPAIYDMANREGLTQNDEYQIFVDIIQDAIRVFETDRQGFYREYTQWKEERVKAFGKDANIRADVEVNMSGKKDSVKKKQTSDGGQPDSNVSIDQESKYTEEEYQETVYKLMQEAKEALNAKQILQMLSSSGLILSTFFHEFRAVQAEYGSRAPQLRHRIDYMIENENLYPGFIFDPHIIINQMQQTDEMLELWLKVAMEGVLKINLDSERQQLGSAIEEIRNIWQELLASKKIDIELKGDFESETEYEISKTDIYIILNNFLLNSVYFLEKEQNASRKIEITLKEQKHYFYLNLWNNGPRLDEKYKDVQNRIFELGESSKPNEEGTGVGLWITKETIERNDGTVTIDERTSGFGLDIYLKRIGGI